MRESQVQHIYNKVKELIMQRAIFPGARLVEDDIARENGVSRAVVRNSMIALQNEGFVRIIPNKGSYVIKPTYEEVVKVYHARRHLELGAAELAVRNITDEAIVRMEKNYEEQLLLKDDFNIIKYAALNRQFHWEIVQAADHEYYTKYLTEIYNIVHVYMIFFDAANDNSGSLKTHALLLEGLKERNLTKVEEAIRLDNATGMDDLKISYGCVE